MHSFVIILYVTKQHCNHQRLISSHFLFSMIGLWILLHLRASWQINWTIVSRMYINIRHSIYHLVDFFNLHIMCIKRYQGIIYNNPIIMTNQWFKVPYKWYICTYVGYWVCTFQPVHVSFHKLFQYKNNSQQFLVWRHLIFKWRLSI